MAFSCRACGLVIFNGSCLHASVEEVAAEQAKHADQQAASRKR